MSFLFAQSKDQKDDLVQALAKDQLDVMKNSSIASHVAFLFGGLIGIVLLIEFVASGVEDGLTYLNVAQKDSIVGAMTAFVLLLPDAISAIKASLDNQLQRGLNIALGAACATIGLTIPAKAVASLILSRPLTLGLGHGDIVLIFMALATSVVSFATGRTTLLTGLSHLAIFVAYLLLIVVP